MGLRFCPQLTNAADTSGHTSSLSSICSSNLFFPLALCNSPLPLPPQYAQKTKTIIARWTYWYWNGNSLLRQIITLSRDFSSQDWYGAATKACLFSSKQKPPSETTCIAVALMATSVKLNCLQLKYTYYTNKNRYSGSDMVIMWKHRILYHNMLYSWLVYLQFLWSTWQQGWSFNVDVFEHAFLPGEMGKFVWVVSNKISKYIYTKHI